MTNFTVKQIVGMLRHEKKGKYLLVTVDGIVISAYWCDFYGQYADTLKSTEKIVGYFREPIKMDILREMICIAQEG